MRFFLFLIFTLLAYPSFSQKNEFGLTLGTSLFKGDAHNNIGINDNKPALGLFYRNNYHSHFALRTGFLYGTLKSSDAVNNSYTQDDIHEKIRGLSFSSHYWEISAVNEFYLVDKSSGKKFCPYFFAGGGIMHFNPTTVYNGTKYHLRDYHTEGQGLAGYEKEYKLTTLTGILGIGAKIPVGSSVCLGFEYGFRFTHSDYIDDVHGNYADPVLLQENWGLTSVQLSDRSYEASSSDIQLYNYVAANGTLYYDANGNPHIEGYGIPSDKRGTNSRNDRYLVFNLSLSYILKK